uniref:Ig-like domain-containing protein n=1 Tax=Oryzias latipes TaxID=8090 RepID=A0A3P9LIA5_ORYLA
NLASCFTYVYILNLVCSPSTVQAHLGQDVVLSCRVEPPSDLTNETLEWTNGTEDVHVGGDNYDDQDLRFKNRTILNHQNLKDGNVSLTLTNVKKEDEGTYTLCLPNHDICFIVTLIVGKLLNSEGGLTKVEAAVILDSNVLKLFCFLKHLNPPEQQADPFF